MRPARPRSPPARSASRRIRSRCPASRSPRAALSRRRGGSRVFGPITRTRCSASASSRSRTRSASRPRALAPLLAPPLERPRFLATPFGTVVAAALCQRSQASGDLLAVEGLLAVVGLGGHLAFDAALVAAGLERYRARGGPPVRAVEVDPGLRDLALLRPHELARALEQTGAAEAFGASIRAALPDGAGAALLPPVLGLHPGARVPERVALEAGVPVAESLSDVPSVPGVRLQASLEAALAAAGVQVVQGSLRAPPGREPRRTSAIRGSPPRAGCSPPGGSWAAASPGAERCVRRRSARRCRRRRGPRPASISPARPAASLTLRARTAPQPLLSAGLRVDAMLRPLDARGRPAADGLFAAGAVVGGHEQATDGTGLGVAILTGLRSPAAARAGGGGDV